MKLQSLSTLTSVVAHGSFAAAAEQVNLTPSAVSLQMKQLEDYFRQPLFDRSGRNVRPTPFALTLAKTVERAVADLEALRSDSDRAPAGRVRLGITESAMTTLLPPAFAYLQAHAPQIQLQISRGSTPELLADVKAGRVDAAVLIRPPSGGSSRLHWTMLLAEEFVLLVAEQVTGRDVRQLLERWPWIRMDRELVAGQIAARFVNRLLPHHQPLLDVPGIDAIVALVAAGVGVSVLPRLRPQLQAAYPVRQVALGRGAPIRQMALVRRAADAGNRRFDVVEHAFVAAAGRATNSPQHSS